MPPDDDDVAESDEHLSKVNENVRRFPFSSTREYFGQVNLIYGRQRSHVLHRVVLHAPNDTNLIAQFNAHYVRQFEKKSQRH